MNNFGTKFIENDIQKKYQALGITTEWGALAVYRPTKKEDKVIWRRCVMNI